VSAETEKKDLEKKILNHEKTNNYTQGKSIRKVIIVPGRIVNLVVN
jgi:leucyl-tRNA synthetase